MELAPMEEAVAEFVAAARCDKAIPDRGGPISNRIPDPLENEVNAVAAELAVAKYFRRWPESALRGGPDAPHQGDVAGMEVRWTIHADGELRLGATARRDQVHILVTGKRPVFILRGWIRRGDLTDEFFLAKGDRRGGYTARWDQYLVPQRALASMSQLSVFCADTTAL